MCFDGDISGETNKPTERALIVQRQNDLHKKFSLFICSLMARYIASISWIF